MSHIFSTNRSSYSHKHGEHLLISRKQLLRSNIWVPPLHVQTVVVNLIMCTIQRIDWVCDHFDHEPTDYHSCSRCVLYYSRMVVGDLMRFTEAREQQSSVIASPPKPPMLNTKASSMSSGDRTIAETMVNRDLTGDPPKDSHNPPIEVDIEKRISIDQYSGVPSSQMGGQSV